MALRYPYADAYLAGRVSQAREDQAYREVGLLGTFPADWVERLTVLRTYMITCIEMQTQDGDIFGLKLKSYRADFNDGLVQARIAQAAVDAATGTPPAGGGSIFSIDLQRA